MVTEAQWLAGQGAGTKKSDQPSAEALRIFKALGKLLEMSDEEVEKALSPDADDDEDAESDENEADNDAESDENEGVSKEERRAIKKRQQRRESVVQARIAVQNRAG